MIEAIEPSRSEWDFQHNVVEQEPEWLHSSSSCIIIKPWSQLTALRYMNLTFSFCLIQNNLISFIKCLTVISNCFCPSFLRSSSPLEVPVTSKLSLLLTIASMGLIFRWSNDIRWVSLNLFLMGVNLSCIYLFLFDP